MTIEHWLITTGMKIEIEVDDALIQALGEEAIRTYLIHKASQMQKALQPDTIQTGLPPGAGDTEAIQKAWTQFNKRGISC